MNKEYIGKTFKELKKLIGKPISDQDVSIKSLINFLKYPQKIRPQDSPKSEFFKTDFEEAIKNSGVDVDTTNPVFKYWYKHPDDIPDEELPLEWDWRKVNGVNYVNPPRGQGRCGSCYIIGSLNTLESRIRIATNNEAKVYSFIMR